MWKTEKKNKIGGWSRNIEVQMLFVESGLQRILDESLHGDMKRKNKRPRYKQDHLS